MGAMVLGFLAAQAARAASGTAPAAPQATSSAEAVAAACLREARHDSAVLAGMERLHAMDYDSAEAIFSRSLPQGSAAAGFFRGLNLFHRFNDRGDAWALARAESLWTAVAEAPSAPTGAGRDAEANLGLYRGLATLQLSYAANLRGQDLRAARLGRKAAVLLEPRTEFAEASAALALYDYYKAVLLKGVDWLPFVKPDAAGPLRRLEDGVTRSRYLGDVLKVSLVWLHYDAGRYDEGLRLVDGVLGRHPGNRTWRQIRADFLFRRAAGSPTPSAAPDLAAARALHEELLKEYSALMQACPPPGCLPLGYLSSVGNLVKIHGHRGDADLRRKYRDIWSESRFQPLKKWLPGSLKREVETWSK